MRFLIFTFPMLLLFFYSNGFAQNPPKTIFELYQIEYGGCDLYDASGKFVDEEVMVEEVSDFLEVPPPPPVR